MDMSRHKNLKAAIEEHIGKIQYDVDILKRDRAEFKLKATRTEHEMQKVCEYLCFILRLTSLFKYLQQK